MMLSVDANAYRAFVDNDPVFVEAIQSATQLAFPVVVLGELRAAFRHGTRREQNEEILRQILARRRVTIHEISQATSIIYAQIWSELRAMGRPIPTNDVWIAAQCIEHDFALLTHDDHFRHVPGFRVLPR